MGNTQQNFKKRMDGHFSDLQRLLKNGKKSDSFSAQFVQHFNIACLPGAPGATMKRYQGGEETMAGGAAEGAIEDGRAICGSTESRAKAEEERH